MEENISLFVGITGASTSVARGFLEIVSGNFERAIELYFENPDLVGAGITSTTAATTTTTTTTSSSSRSSRARARPSAGRQDASGVIHISSDDEDDQDHDDANNMQFDDDDDARDSDDNDDIINNDNADNDDDDANERAAALQAAAIAQEEADAEMAKRLQEEMYQDAGSGSGNVRAPIARTTETLIAPDPSWGMGGGYDMVEASLREQLRSRRRNASRGTGPFAQRIWGDAGSTPSAAGPAGPAAENGALARRLEDLFRPPYDLMARLSWDEAREEGKEKKRWIMVNLQDMNDFNCQTLNRDIWKDQAVRELVMENFVFLQYDKDFPDSQEYLTFYFPDRGHENPDNYPHVSIIDPRTGEQVKVWSGRPFPSAREFHAEVAEFLDRYSLAANSKNPVAKMGARKPQPVLDVDRMTEEEMLEMALKNSLAGASGAGSSAATPSIVDPDSLTKLREGGNGSGSGSGGGGGTRTGPRMGAGTGTGTGTGTSSETGMEMEDEPEPEPEPELESGGGGGGGEREAFERISRGNPHIEPANDAALTTRIQFRHPSGRIIRRFRLGDSVRRTYEWLKAEPLAGREGVAFELKRMPEGMDLIGSLDETIEGAGLKQGTVMIEFLTEG